MNELFVVMDGRDQFVYGGGSSTKSYIRAFDNAKSAERSRRQLPTAEYVWIDHKFTPVDIGPLRVERFLSEDVIDAIKVGVASHIWDQPELALEINAIIDRIV